MLQVGGLLAVHRGADGAALGDADARRGRALLAVGHLLDDLARVAAVSDDDVAWVEATGPSGRGLTLRAAPVEVGPLLADRLWPHVTAVLTSATALASASSAASSTTYRSPASVGDPA